MTEFDTRAMEDSLEISRRKSDITGQLQTLSQLGRTYQAQRKYQKALSYFRQALDIVKGRDNPDERIFALINMGCVYWEMAQLKKAMGLFQGALSIAGEIGDDAGRKMLSAIMGVSYWRKGEWAEAIRWLEQALPIRPADETESNSSQQPASEKYKGLQVVMERGAAILENRIQIAQDRHDPARILLPKFAMTPLLLFIGRKEEIPRLLEEIVPLAQQLNNTKILDAIPLLQKLIGAG